MNWPRLTPERADELAEKARQAETLLTEVASAITRYPGGGAPAHVAREGATSAKGCAQRIDLLKPEATG